MKNLITDVPGIKVGNADDDHRLTGVTVVVPDEAAVAAVDVRGGGPGTRETDALDPAALVEHVHAICISGGSAFGLDAAGGVMRWLRQEGRGFLVGDARVPIVPSAILFDLNNGGDKNFDVSPYTDLGFAAASDLQSEFALGNVGAGFGATAGPLKGGLGSASACYVGGAMVGALVAVNSFGSVTMGDEKTFWAGPYEEDAEFGGLPVYDGPVPVPDNTNYLGPMGANTTIAIVATDLSLTQAHAKRVAIMAHDGFARAIHPVHTPLDGDTVFVVSTGRRSLKNPVGDIAELGAVAATTTARAIARGVYEARTIPGFPSWRERFG